MDGQSLNVNRRPSLSEALITLTRRGPVHAILLVIGIIWLAPSVGLAVTSFRTRGDISASGWWTVASGSRTVTDKIWELRVLETGDGGDNTVIAGAALSGELLTDAVEGLPAATVDRVRIQQITGDITVEAFGQPIELAGVGTVIVHEDGDYDFTPAEDYAGAFVTKIDSAATPFSAEFQLQGFETIQGELVIEEIGEAERVPRAGKLRSKPTAVTTSSPEQVSSAAHSRPRLIPPSFRTRRSQSNTPWSAPVVRCKRSTRARQLNCRWLERFMSASLELPVQCRR